jgi:ATP sulfurylase
MMKMMFGRGLVAASATIGQRATAKSVAAIRAGNFTRRKWIQMARTVERVIDRRGLAKGLAWSVAIMLAASLQRR